MVVDMTSRVRGPREETQGHISRTQSSLSVETERETLTPLAPLLRPSRTLKPAQYEPGQIGNYTFG